MYRQIKANTTIDLSTHKKIDTLFGRFVPVVKYIRPTDDDEYKTKISK